MRWSDEVSTPIKSTKLHKVVILDGSGSMQGDKYNNAELGVRQDYEACKKEFADYLLIEFSNRYTSKLYDFTGALTFNPEYGGTALYDTIIKVFDSLSHIPDDEKVLVQIFTDGEDLHSIHASHVAKARIDKFNAKGWTVTFVGTEKDVKLVQKKLGIDSTNTLVHDNTAKGVTRSFETFMEAQSTYTKNISKGVDVTSGFFKDINNKTNG